MKLRNKRTGEIGTLIVDGAYNFVTNFAVEDDERNRLGEYNSLTELNAEWCDYEEPKKWFTINKFDGSIQEINDDTCAWTDEEKESIAELGFRFETKEETEKALEKLKAWKRLKDKGFRFKMWEWEFIYNDNISGELIIKAHIDDATDSDGKYTKDLDLLFSGEDD